MLLWLANLFANDVRGLSAFNYITLRTLLATATSMGIALAIGPRIQVAAPSGGKADFGVRAVLIFVFPK